MRLIFDMTKVDSDALFKIEKALRAQGVGFDTGYNVCGQERVWELDWSLRGPVKAEGGRLCPDPACLKKASDVNQSPKTPGAQGVGVCNEPRS